MCFVGASGDQVSCLRESAFGGGRDRLLQEVLLSTGTMWGRKPGPRAEAGRWEDKRSSEGGGGPGPCPSTAWLRTTHQAPFSSLRSWPGASRRGATRLYFTWERSAWCGCGSSHAHLGALLRQDTLRTLSEGACSSCGHMAALLPCCLCPELGPRRRADPRRPHGKASWSGNLPPCLAVTLRAGGCVQARTPESHHLWGSGSWVGAPVDKKGTGLVMGQQSSASHLQTRSLPLCCSRGLAGGRNLGTTVGLFCPCCFSRTSREVLGPWDGAPCGGGGGVGVRAWAPLPSQSLRPGVVAATAPASFPKASLCSRRVLTHPLSILFLDFSP